MMEPNSSNLWDSFWMLRANDTFAIELENERYGIRWQRLQRVMTQHFGQIKGLNIIEVGAGSGTVAVLLAQCGAHVTILDYSKQALNRAERLCKKNGVQATFVLMDVKRMSKHLYQQFDVSMSFGLAEHFSGDDRISVIQSHFDLLKPGGLSLISVPNKWNIPYQLYKLLLTVAGKWSVGEEYPFSRQEFRQLSRLLDIDQYCFVGDSVMDSLRFLNLKRFILRLFNHPLSYKVHAKRRPEKGTWLDEYLAYSLVFCGVKPRFVPHEYNDQPKGVRGQSIK